MPQMPLLPRAMMRGLGWISHPLPALGTRVAFHFMTTPGRRRTPLAGTPMAEHRLRTASGLVVHAWGQAGPLVICIHGWQGAGHQFAPLARHLAMQGLRVWAVDAAAHGESPGKRATPVDLLHALREASALAGEPAAVIGHSLGAAMAMVACREGAPFPRRVLVSGPTSFAEVFERFDRHMGLSPRAREALFGRIEAHVGRTMESMNLLRQPPAGDALVIHDEDDTEVPVLSTRSLAEVWPQAEVWITRGLGHVRILRAEAVWERVADYLVSSAGQTAGLVHVNLRSRLPSDASLPG